MRDKKDKRSRATKSDAGNSSTAPTKPPAAQPVDSPQKPQRLFDALLATLPHLQDMENALETKQQVTTYYVYLPIVGIMEIPTLLSILNGLKMVLFCNIFSYYRMVTATSS